MKRICVNLGPRMINNNMRFTTASGILGSSKTMSLKTQSIVIMTNSCQGSNMKDARVH